MRLVSGRHGQNKYHLYVPQILSSIGKNSFYYSGVLIWNNLPPVCMSLITYQILRHRLKYCIVSTVLLLFILFVIFILLCVILSVCIHAYVLLLLHRALLKSSFFELMQSPFNHKS